MILTHLAFLGLPSHSAYPRIASSQYDIPDLLFSIHTSVNLEVLLNRARSEPKAHESCGEDGIDDESALSELTDIESETEQPAPTPPSKSKPSTSTQPSKRMLYKSSYKRKRKAEKLARDTVKRRKIRDCNLDDLCSVPPIQTQLDAANLSASSTAWTGIRQSVEGCTYPIDKLLRQHPQLQLVHWEGKHPQAILDCKCRLIASLAGMPKDYQRWLCENEEGLRQKIEQMSEELSSHFSWKNRQHCHGVFIQARRGVSMGGGERVSTNAAC